MSKEKKMLWFRLYRDIIQDDKIKLLAFEDRWHFIAFLCMKADGLLDEPESDLKHRRIAVNLGVQLREMDEIKRRLCEVGLTDKEGCPAAWDDLQFKSDSSSERVKKYRENKMKRYRNVTVTPQETETDTDTEYKNISCDTENSFARFWKNYPRKTDKAKSVQVWSKLKPSADLVTTIIKNINDRINSGEWSADRISYIPHPTTYLRGRRWEDLPVDRPLERSTRSRDLSSDYQDKSWATSGNKIRNCLALSEIF